MRRKQWALMMGVVAVLLMASAVPRVDAASKTLYVGTCHGTSRYTTIQSAVDAVNDTGFTIYVCPGTYHETVTIQQKYLLTIRNYVVKNQPAPLIDAGYTGSDPNDKGFVVLHSYRVTIRGVRITHALYAIYADHSPKTEVRNTIISASAVGIYFSSSGQCLAQQNSLSDSSSVAIRSQGSVDVIIKQNTIVTAGDGIYVDYSGAAVIESNSVTTSGDFGIISEGGKQTRIERNTANFARNGILVFNSSLSTVNENTAKGNSQAGILVSADSATNTFTKNLLQGNGTDAVDPSHGSATAGTANTWTNNTCDTSTPAGLCSTPATSRVPNT